MHDSSVTHMNLKPVNVLVPPTYGRPTMVDFCLSVRLRNKTHLSVMWEQRDILHIRSENSDSVPTFVVSRGP